MTSKDRVLTTFANQEGDRVPINYSANLGVDRRLKEYYGLNASDDEGLRKSLGVDFRSVGAGYAGPKLHKDIPNRGVKVDNWGIHRRWVKHETGGYWDFCDFPLQNATEEEIAVWPMPSPDDYDYSGVLDACKKYEQYAINGAAGYGDIINGNGMLRGMEQTLVDLITDDPAGLLLADRRMDVQLEVTRRILEAAKGVVDFIWLGKERFGGRLAFHGCISTAGPVACGSVQDVVDYCRAILEIMMPGGGYCFAPTHQLQDNSPTENVVAMYETARIYGAYSYDGVRVEWLHPGGDSRAKRALPR